MKNNKINRFTIYLINEEYAKFLDLAVKYIRILRPNYNLKKVYLFAYYILLLNYKIT